MNNNQLLIKFKKLGSTFLFSFFTADPDCFEDKTLSVPDRPELTKMWTPGASELFKAEHKVGGHNVISD